MALKTNYVTSMGFTAQDTYACITSFQGSKENIQVHVVFYYNETARTNHVEPLGYETHGVVLENGATMQEMYNALKLLPEFAGALDV